MPALQLPKALPFTREPKPPGVTCANADAGSMEARRNAKRQLKDIMLVRQGSAQVAVRAVLASAIEKDPMGAGRARCPDLLILGWINEGTLFMVTQFGEIYIYSKVLRKNSNSSGTQQMRLIPASAPA